MDFLSNQGNINSAMCVHGAPYGQFCQFCKAIVPTHTRNTASLGVPLLTAAAHLAKATEHIQAAQEILGRV